MIKLVKLVSSVLVLSVANMTAQAGLIINTANEITGVDGIIVDGESRTFDFVSGSFDDLFGGMADPYLGGVLGRQFALAFRSVLPSPSRIAGCSSPSSCTILIPENIVQVPPFRAPVPIFGVQFEQILVRESFLQGVRRNDALVVGGFAYTLPFDLTTREAFTFAVLRPIVVPGSSTPTGVPEPGTMGLLGLSLLGLGIARRVKPSKPKLV